MSQNVVELKKHIEENRSIKRDLSVSIDDGVLVVTDKDLQHFPVYVTMTNTEVTCMSTLVGVGEIEEEKKAVLNELLLTSNPALDLSNFGIFGGNYVIFGELSSTSTFEEIVLELDTLFDNIVEALKVFQSFVK